MKKPSKNPLSALRGLCAAGLLTATLLAAASANAALVNFRFIYSGVPYNTAVATGVITVDSAVVQNPGNNDGYFGPGQPLVNISMTVSGASSGNGYFNSLDFTNYFFDISTALNLNTPLVGQPGLQDLNFFNTLINSNAPRGEEVFYLVTSGGNGDGMTLLSVLPDAPVAYFKQGDAVPGIAGATFTSFGVPAVNDSGMIAVVGNWKTAANQTGSGVFANGELVLKVGDTIIAPSGTVTVGGLADPVINDLGYVAFLATFNTPSSGAHVVGETGGNSRVSSSTGVMTTAPFLVTGTAVQKNVGPVVAHVVAQTGTPVGTLTAAAVSPISTPALWQSFSSVALLNGAGGVLFTGSMKPGVGGITSANANGVWANNFYGSLNLILQAGTTMVGTNTVRSFSVLNTVSGSPGQTHAFNNTGELVANVTYVNGTSAIAVIPLPAIVPVL